MPWLYRIVSMLAGAALSAGLHISMTPAPAARSAPAPAPADAASTPTACPEVTSNEERSLQRQVLRARLELAAAEAHRAARDGAPVPWPNDPGPLAPDTLQRTLDGALDELQDVELRGLECDEFPCIATLSAPHVGPPEVTSSAQLDRLMAALGDETTVWSAQTGQAGPEDDRRDVVTVAIGTGEPPEGTSRRMATRVEVNAQEARLAEEDTGA